MDRWLQEAFALHQAGRLAEAEPLYLKSLDLDERSHPALYLMGVLRVQQGRAAEALPYIQRALAVQPDAPETLANYGIALEHAGRYSEALQVLEKVVRISPNDSRAWSNCGVLRFKVQRSETALADLDRAIALDPASAEAWLNRGTVLMGLKRTEEALESFERSLRLRPESVEARHSRAFALHATGQSADALAELDRILQQSPNHLRALLTRATVLGELGQVERQLETYDRVLAIQPDMVEALINRAHCLRTFRMDLAGAIADQKRAVAIQPDYPFARGDLVHMKMLAADWRDLAGEVSALDQGVHEGRRVVNPYVYQGVSSSPADLLTCARIYTTHKYPPLPGPVRHRHRQGKIRLGYVCSDFRAQATMHLAAGLFEHHDRSRFDVIAFDNSIDDGSPMRRRVIEAFDKFVPIQNLSERQAAALVTENEIDILVNLNGYFGVPRMGVFALRAAPVQVNYLGYPGSLGAEYMDYIIADGEVIPSGEERFYAEKVVRLPDCYQINDRERPLPKPSSRARHGLREGDFVFCHFNHSYKLTPEVFAVWMRLLKNVEPSVLWLLESNALFAANVRSEAARAGIDPGRLIFAPLIETSAHLARMALGDLFLDSLPYNAHTTASDALWTGLPLLTCRGQTFAGRVAASLLRAAGLPELITDSLQEYESMGLALARNRQLLQSYRERLTRDRMRIALFDTKRTTQRIEIAYEHMMARWHGKQPADTFAISD